jgi:geranylgeranyl diphosphate synthase type II
MSISTRIEKSLEQAVSRAQVAGSPPRLAAALHYAVFPGGHRIRPQLCLAVARACGDRDPEAASAVAAAIELMHCASLVHDDLPCFDDASIRRGKPSVHVEFGSPLAVLAGDALIVMAFETLTQLATTSPQRMVQLISLVARSVGAPFGIVAGQAWECEERVSLSHYQQAKTGALFVAATSAGALASGADPVQWATLGQKIGEAYQVADDLRDVLCDEAELGKPIGQDATRLRPNAAAQLGIHGAKQHLEELVHGAVNAVPDCPGKDELRAIIEAQTRQFVPKQLSALAA